MFAVRDDHSSFLWCRHWITANHRSADRLAGAIASSRNDRAHSVKLTLAALTLSVAAASVSVSAASRKCVLRQAAGVCPALYPHVAICQIGDEPAQKSTIDADLI
ncbi:unnamed protein product [Heligmosomoides polygyrus]|uniref:Lipoprotein n=1 Tax=Heligmosomoides polygyrus TaxID=6339 RepID=A0A183GEK8_HELPZ|nr:unnamed protein product [Heligmosomoides polygyrus]